MTTARSNEKLLWAQPEDLLQLGVMHSTWIWGQDRFTERPGDPAGFRPVDVIGAAAEFAGRGATERIRPTLLRANAAGWITRDWTVPYEWVTGNRHVDVHRIFPAVFGYCSPLVALDLVGFASTYGYMVIVRSSASEGAAGAPHVYVRGKLDVPGCIGWQRSPDDIDREWPDCNPTMREALYGAAQVTLWSPEPTLWADLAAHYKAGYQEVRP